MIQTAREDAKSANNTAEPRESLFRVGRSERGLLVGQTGTGKSTLANFLLRDKSYLIIIDAKGDFQFTGEHVVVVEPDELTAKRKPGQEDAAILYRPIPEYSEPGDYDRVFHWIYNRSNTFIYIDELTAVTRNAASFPPWLRAIYVQGRGKGIGILGATQRPANLPLFVMSESTRFWMFRLLLKKDIDRMADFMGANVRKPLAHSHGFYFKSTLSREPAKSYVLNLK